MSICSPNIYLDFDWSVLDDLHGSDHFPIKIEEIESTMKTIIFRWNLNKANWENFIELCNEKLKPEMLKTADNIQGFTDTLIHIAEKCIPKSNALGENFHKNSSSTNYSENFQNIKQEREKEHLNFMSLNHEKYNIPFTASELLDALHKSHDTATGPDDIHYQILKHLPDNALETLLNILNDIWITGKFPKDWSKATIIPIPKPNKDHTEATNYRHIALTSCLCKTMERMINDRLVWFLESNQLITKYQAGFRKK